MSTQLSKDTAINALGAEEKVLLKRERKVNDQDAKAMIDGMGRKKESSFRVTMRDELCNMNKYKKQLYNVYRLHLQIPVSSQLIR